MIQFLVIFKYGEKGAEEGEEEFPFYATFLIFSSL